MTDPDPSTRPSAIRPFISYAREIGQTVRRLCDDLVAARISPWLDESRLLPGERLSGAIEIAILECDAYVLIVSPETVESRWCRREFAFAIQHNKPIFPLIAARPTDDGWIHAFPGIDDILWIDLPALGWRGALERLTHVLSVMPGVRRTHARLLARAATWDESGRSEAHLLFGADLESGRAYLAGASPDAPPPTLAMRALVEASDLRDRERREEFKSLYEEARLQRQRAVELLATSYLERARRHLRDRQYMRAALLLTESLELRDGAECRALLGVAMGPVARRRAAVVAHARYLVAAALDRSGHQLLSIDHDGRCAITPLERGGIERTWDTGREGAIDGAFVEAARGLVIAWSDGTVQCRRVDEPERVTSAIRPFDRLDALSVSPDGRQVALVGGQADEPRARLCVATIDGGALAVDDASEWPASHVAWLDDDEIIRVEPAGAIVVQRIGAQTPSHSWAPSASDPRIGRLNGVEDNSFHAVAIAASVKTRVVAVSYSWQKSGLPFIAIWHLDRGDGPSIERASIGPAFELTFSDDGRWLLAGTIDHAAVAWDLTADLSKTVLVEHTGPIHALGFLELDRTFAISGDGEGHILVWEPESGLVTARLDGHFDAIHALETNGREILSAGADGLLMAWRPAPVDVSSLAGAWPAMSATAVSDSAERRMAASLADLEIGVWELGGERPTSTLRGHRQGTEVLAFGGAIALAAGGDEGEVAVWRLDAPSGEPLILKGHGRAIKQLFFLDDARRLLTSSLDEKTIIWDLETGANLGEFPFGGMGVAVHPELPWGVIADEAGTLHVIDLVERAEVAQCTGHRGAVLHVAISRAGTWISGGEDGTARVWETAAASGAWRTACRHVAHLGADLMGVDVTPDGRRLATASLDGAARIWTPDGEQVASLDGHAFIWHVSLHAEQPLAVTLDVKEGLARLWHTESGGLIDTLECPTSLLHGARFMRDRPAILLNVARGGMMLPGAGRRKTRGGKGSNVVFWRLPFEARDPHALRGLLERLPYALRDGRLLRRSPPNLKGGALATPWPWSRQGSYG